MEKINNNIEVNVIENGNGCEVNQNEVNNSNTVTNNLKNDNMETKENNRKNENTEVKSLVNKIENELGKGKKPNETLSVSTDEDLDEFFNFSNDETEKVTSEEVKNDTPLKTDGVVKPSKKDKKLSKTKKKSKSKGKVKSDKKSVKKTETKVETEYYDSTTKTEIITVNIDDLTIHPLHTKIYGEKVDFSDIKLSLEKNKQSYSPIIVNTDYQITEGVRRWLCYKDLKYKTVDVIVKDIPKEETLHSIITSNFHRKNNCLQTLNIFDSLMGLYSHQGKKTSVTISTEDGKPQVKKGGNVTRDNVCKMMGVSYTNIDRLKKIKDFDIELFKKIDDGKKSINKIYRNIGKKGKDTNTDTTTDFSNLNVSDSELFKVMKYDEETNMYNIDEESIQCIVTSPLIFKGIDIETNIKHYIDDISNRLIDCKTVLTVDGSLFLVMEDTQSDGLMNNIPFRVLMKLIRKGYKHIETIIWEYSPLPTIGEKRLTHSFRYIFHLTKSLGYYQNTVSRNIRRNVIPENTNGETELYDKYGIYKGKKWNSVWYSENILKTKSSVSELIPIGLILDSTKEGDTVMNPFDTDESVGLVSLFYDRKFVGFTDDEEYGKKQSDVFHRFLNEYRKVG